MTLQLVVPAVDLGVAGVAAATIAVLFDVAALAPARLTAAWHVLSALLGCCVLLLFAHAACALERPPGAADLLGAAVFVFGVSFIYLIAWLSRRTARDMLRVEGVARAAYCDPLTEIGNRRRFNEGLDAAVRDAERLGRPLSVIALDVDHFKAVNDRHGHAVGDEVLKRVARAVAGAVRTADTACRVGGEEFAVIVPQLEPAFASGLAEQIRAAVAALRVPTGEGDALRVTVSLGFAALAPGEDAASLLRRADAALYAAKHAGRDRLRIAV